LYHETQELVKPNFCAGKTGSIAPVMRHIDARVKVVHIGVGVEGVRDVTRLKACGPKAMENEIESHSAAIVLILNLEHWNSSSSLHPYYTA